MEVEGILPTFPRHDFPAHYPAGLERKSPGIMLRPQVGAPTFARGAFVNFTDEFDGRCLLHLLKVLRLP